MGKGRLSPSRSIAVVFVMLILGGTTVAAAKVFERGQGRSQFYASFAPKSLPRGQRAPIALNFGFNVRQLSAMGYQELSSISLNLSPRLSIDSAGLPRCGLSELQEATTGQLGYTCKDAKVGHGTLPIHIDLPGDGFFSILAPLIAFNGSYQGKPAILTRFDFDDTVGHRVYVFAFVLNHQSGVRGTSLVAEVPPIDYVDDLSYAKGPVSERVFVMSMDLTLDRDFTASGKRRGYVSARCSPTGGVHSNNFPLARMSYTLQDGTEGAGGTNGWCRVRAKGHRFQ